VNPKLGQDLAGAKPEIADRPITLLGRGKVRSACNDGGHGNSSDKDESHKGWKSHLALPCLPAKTPLGETFWNGGPRVKRWGAHYRTGMSGDMCLYTDSGVGRTLLAALWRTARTTGQRLAGAK
jgi:hypothetical protein